MKGARTHRVPLPGPAVSLLLALRGDADPATGDLIFPGSRGQALSDMALTELLRGTGLTDPHGETITAHGCRSSFRDWAAETGQPADIAEQALAHAAGDKVTVAYLRSDLLQRRAALMDAWAGVCCPARTPTV